MSEKSPKKMARWWWLTLPAFAAAAGLFMLAMSAKTTRSYQLGAEPLYEVQRGPLTISVDVSGTVRSGQAIVLKSEVEGRNAIISMVDEGTQVKAGDLIIELDASQLKDRKVDQEITVQTGEANFVRARENLTVIRKQGESNVDTAKLQYEFAKQDVTKYLEGEYPQQLRNSEAQIKLAEGLAEQALDVYDWSQKLYKEGYVTKSELNADKLTYERTQIDLQQAKGDLNLLEKFTHERTLAQLKSEVNQKHVAYLLAKHTAASNVVDAEAELLSSEAKLKREKEKLAKMIEQIAKSKIRAPIDGMVVYFDVEQRGPDEPLTEGTEVFERQPLVRLPTTSKLVADVKVHESQIKKVREGLPVRLSTDALPDRTFTGTIKKIAVLPDSQSRWLNPDLKVYNTEIEIDPASGEGLRPGMSCRAEIVVQHLEDAVYVPVQCVLMVAGQSTVYVPGPEGPVARPVTTGLDNNRMMVIRKGLQKGERVLLAPPLPPSTMEAADAGAPPEMPSKDPPARSRESAPKKRPDNPARGSKTDRPRSSQGDS